jgi:hypothetical protein
MEESYNIRRAKSLGMSYGAANNKLKKTLMFLLVQELGKDVCYHCGKKIENVSEFSIEHKNPWQQSENPYEDFFDLDNITFSHLYCNIAAGSRPHKKYIDAAEQNRESFKRYYAKNGDEWNKRRNARRREKNND